MMTWDEFYHANIDSYRAKYSTYTPAEIDSALLDEYRAYNSALPVAHGYSNNPGNTVNDIHQGYSNKGVGDFSKEGVEMTNASVNAAFYGAPSIAGTIVGAGSSKANEVIGGFAAHKFAKHAKAMGEHRSLKGESHMDQSTASQTDPTAGAWCPRMHKAPQPLTIKDYKWWCESCQEYCTPA